MACMAELARGTASSVDALSMKHLGAMQTMVQHKRSDIVMPAEKAAITPSEPTSDSLASDNFASSWEAEVLRRIAPRLAEARRRAANGEQELGWEAAGVRRLVEMTGGEA